MANDPNNLVLVQLREIRATLERFDEMDKRFDQLDKRFEDSHALVNRTLA